MRILSVDDSTTIRRTVAQMLRVLGIECVEAVDGQDALEQLEKGLQVDLVLLDVEMPRMTGIELLRQLRMRERFRKLPVIIVSSISQKEVMILAVQEGANQYLTKPFSSEELLTRVVETLELDSMDDPL